MSYEKTPKKLRNRHFNLIVLYLLQMSMENKYELGCIMVILDKNASTKILEFNRELIPEKLLYNDESNNYGRSLTPHITCKYGLTEDYSKEDMGRVISLIKPFTATLTKVDMFETPEFDVVKFNVESPTLVKLNKLFSKLPNVDEHKIYHAHLTLAYVKMGEGKKFIRNITPVQIKINRIKYTNTIGEYFYDL